MAVTSPMCPSPRHVRNGRPAPSNTSICPFCPTQTEPSALTAMAVPGLAVLHRRSRRPVGSNSLTSPSPAA